MQHRISARWAAVVVGIGLLAASTPARADNLGKLGEAFVAFVMLVVGLAALGGLTGLGIFIAAAVMGRRSAPVAPWKRTLAVLGIVFSSLTSALNVVVLFVLLTIVDAVANRPSSSSSGIWVAFALGVLPLAFSICGIIWSARLYGRNRDVGRQPHPAPQQYAPQQYPPQQYAPQQYAPQQYPPQQ